MDRIHFATLLVAGLLALSGCTDDTEAPEDDDAGDDVGDPGQDSNATNAAPTASLGSKSQNVTVPGNVTLSLDGSDADGDSLVWTLYLNDTEIAAGDALPSEHVHFIDAAGNHTFQLVVDDGNATTEANLTVLGIATPELGPEPVHIELDIARSCYQCYITQVGAAPDNCVGLQQGENNEDCAWTEIDDSWRGRAFATDGPSDIDVAWYTTCEAGNEIETIGAAGHDAGTIHADAGCMVLWDWDTNPDAGIITIDIA